MLLQAIIGNCANVEQVLSINQGLADKCYFLISWVNTGVFIVLTWLENWNSVITKYRPCGFHSVFHRNMHIPFPSESLKNSSLISTLSSVI